jgi:hypothetical protein
MFLNRTGALRTDAEAIAEKIKNLPEEEVGALDERKLILCDVLNSFNARIGTLTEHEKSATMSLFYQKIAETVFAFHLSIEANASREKIACAKTYQGKVAALLEFKAIAHDLAMLYGID